MDPESEGRLLTTIESFRPCLALLPCREKIIVYGDLLRVARLFSISTGECLHTYHINRSLEVLMPLGDADAFACGADSLILVHRISDGVELDRYRHREGWSSAFAWLESGRFLVGTTEGEILEMQWSEEAKLTRNRTFAPCLYKYIDQISVSGDRFAVCSYDASLVAVFKVDTFERVGAVHPELPNCVHLTDTVLVAGCDEGQILVYDALTFDVLCEMNIQSLVRSVHVMSDARRILSCGSDGSFQVQDFTTGATLWQRKFNRGVWDTVPLSAGCLITAFDKSVILHSVPQETQECSPRTAL